MTKQKWHISSCFTWRTSERDIVEAPDNHGIDPKPNSFQCCGSSNTEKKGFVKKKKIPFIDTAAARRLTIKHAHLGTKVMQLRNQQAIAV